jgi:hypothetical protein
MPFDPSFLVSAWLRRARAVGSPADDDIYARTALGQAELRDRGSALPRRLMLVLTVVDGDASVARLRRELVDFPGLEDALEILRGKALVERVGCAPWTPPTGTTAGDTGGPG